MKGAAEMRKSNLKVGIVYSVGGLIFLMITLLIDSRLSSLLFGMAFAAACSGISMVCRYLYWNAEGNRERYAEKLAQEEIEIHDELKVKLRDKSGRYAYVLGLGVISVSIVVFGILGQLEIIGDSRLIVLFLGGYMVFQVFAWNVIYKHLMRKY